MRKSSGSFATHQGSLGEAQLRKQKAPVIPLYSYKVFERLSQQVILLSVDGNYDEVFYDEELDL